MDTLHEALLGHWVGEGSGEYPTIQPFSYLETLVIDAVPGKPLARWHSTTTDAVSGEPRHSETGFLRTAGGACELMLAHSFGITELTLAVPESTGCFRFESQSVVCSPSAKDVTEVVRSISVHDDVLEYGLSMAAVGLELTHHLSARLERRPAP
ncbi:MAG: FABP family protein [Microthrixaceae bacterium]|nr:FABP family protein [Microthrixaceae bacterium]